MKVKEFKSKIRGADALLIATPEYNYSVPGVLKNVIDYASRPYGDNRFDGKPVAIMSASVGMLDGARARIPSSPDVCIFEHTQEKFDANGKLIDENTKKFLKQLLQRLADWTEKLQS